jgi:DUF1680 family protein
MDISNRKINLLDGRQVALKDGFWAERLGAVETVSVPDILDKFERDRGGAFNNYKRTRDHKVGYHSGYPFSDGLVCECIRGISDFLGRHPNKEIEKRLDGYIELMAAAQDVSGDGYLNTYVTNNGIPHRWGTNGGNLLWSHELYNAGAVVEAGVHHYRATGKTNMLRIAVKFANLVTREMGPIPNVNIVPLHSIAEEAFLKLYRLFAGNPSLKDEIGIPVREEDYLNLVKFWLDKRGRHEDRVSFPRYAGEYSTDHMPLKQQTEAVGHAVRAALCYFGMAEYVNLTGDAQYKAAAKRIWRNIVGRKMHITGGIGAIHSEEKFGNEYQLPNDAYLETCASVALLFFAKAMFENEGLGEYVDVMEIALYNNILSGVSLKGNEYFYRNPLMSDGSEKRWEWHACPCCPPMLLKVLGEMPSYIYGTSGDGVYVNLYAPSDARIPLAGGILELAQDTAFPWEDTVRVKLGACPARGFTLRLRVPGYAGAAAVSVNGAAVAEPIVRDGYIALKESWKSGDEVVLKLGIQPQFIASHPYIVYNAGQVALRYGPMVYCIEENDNDMTDVVVPETCPTAVRASKTLPGVTEICFEDTLYRKVTAVPYYAWANRKIGKMQVWIRKENFRNAPAQDWGDALYRPYQ